MEAERKEAKTRVEKKKNGRVVLPVSRQQEVEMIWYSPVTRPATKGWDSSSGHDRRWRGSFISSPCRKLYKAAQCKHQTPHMQK